MGLAGGEFGELHGELHEALEHAEFAGGWLGGLLERGGGGDGVHGFWVRWGSERNRNIFGGG